MILNDIDRVRFIGDLEALRVIADSGRHRILSELIASACSAGELASRLTIPRTRVYYHLELLEKHGFIALAGYRDEGAAERLYRATAASFRVDRALLGNAAASLNDARSALLDAAAEDVRAVAPEDDSLFVLRTFVRLSEKQRGAFRGELDALLARYETGDASGTEMQIVIGFFETPQR
jgi:DNA-binding transcriptional ArsR family regulator